MRVLDKPSLELVEMTKEDRLALKLRARPSSLDPEDGLDSRVEMRMGFVQRWGHGTGFIQLCQSHGGNEPPRFEHRLAGLHDLAPV